MKNKKAVFPAMVLACTLLISALAVTLIHSAGRNKGPAFTGKTAEYCKSLQRAGFPDDYAVALTELHLLHPSWTFTPLDITSFNRQYSWDYIIEQETKHPASNLINGSEAYVYYRHPTNINIYDSGYYQAGTDAVSYFMDPRNFLNEADIFQFYDLSSSPDGSKKAVEAVLKGSFMENRKLENGMTVCDYLMKIGKELSINPVYLAVKLKQEQGNSGTSPIISGHCGDVLHSYYVNQTQKTENGRPVLPPASGLEEAELKALNGFYNPFNISASGTGVFSIYHNAMKRAVTGTPSMKDAWGGSASWDTLWKGIYGGAMMIRKNYIGNRQATVYLQKFNVDPRASDNFSHQYMQNVAGSLQEGRSFFRSFADNDTLDSQCNFLIPVYGLMPAETCKDPARGTCIQLCPSVQRYTVTSSLTSPKRLTDENRALYGDFKVTAGSDLSVKGTLTHSYGIRRLEYSWDGGDFVQCSDSGSLDLLFSDNLPSYGDHILTVRGEVSYDVNNASQKACRYVLFSSMNITVEPPPSVRLTLRSGNSVSEKKYYEGTAVNLPVCEDSNFAGWLGADSSLLPSGSRVILTKDLDLTAFFLDFRVANGASLSLGEPLHLKFLSVLPETEFRTLNQIPDCKFEVRVRLNRDNIRISESKAEIGKKLTNSCGNSFQPFTVCTPTVSSDVDARFSAEFELVLTYADGSEKHILSDGFSATRSARQVALSALADTSAAYSPAVLELFRSIAQQPQK